MPSRREVSAQVAATLAATLAGTMAATLAAGCTPLAPGASPLVVRFDLPDDARFRIETAAYYPSFGVEQQRPVLVGRGSGPVAWTIGIRVES